MENTVRKHAIVYFSSLLLVLSLDLLTKSIASSYISPYEKVSILPFLHLVMVYNTGAAFGILSGSTGIIRVILLLVVPIVAVIITFAYAVKEKKGIESTLMGMIGGGALGNLYDRLFLGYVRDFIYLQYGRLSWPAFNLADASISVAVFVFLILHYLPGLLGSKRKTSGRD